MYHVLKLFFPDMDPTVCLVLELLLLIHILIFIVFCVFCLRDILIAEKYLFKNNCIDVVNKINNEK